MNTILLENVRSAYNVGNIIRTADSLGRSVWLSGYTPSPADTPKIIKTSLGAEENVNLQRFDDTKSAIEAGKKLGLKIISAEITDDAIALDKFSENAKKQGIKDFLVIFGNEVEGVMPETLKSVENIVFIPMQGIKESMNIGQSTAIFMRELGD